MIDKEYQHALDVMEQGIRADERTRVINYIWKEVNRIRFKNCWNGIDFPYSEFVKILDQMKGENNGI